MPVFAAPTVTVQGNHFVEAGQAVRLEGFNANGFQNTTGNIQDIWRTIGGNFVRIRLRWSDLEPASGQYNQVELQTVQTEIQNYAALGVQVLLDMHFVEDGDVPAWVAPYDDWFTDPSTVAEYTPVVQMLVNTFDSDPNVMGYEVWNEPQSAIYTAAETAAVVAWQAQIAKVIQAIDPARAIVVMLRGGWDYGLQNADLSPFAKFKHIVLDFHDQFCGCIPPVNHVQQNGYTSDGEAQAVYPFPLLNADETKPYYGTLADQRAHLKYALRSRQVLHRPIIVGEWEVPAADAQGTVYQAQMLKLFAQYGLSWARWQGPGNGSGPGKWQLEDSYNGPLNAEGQQLEQYFHP